MEAGAACEGAGGLKQSVDGLKTRGTSARLSVPPTASTVLPGSAQSIFPSCSWEASEERTARSRAGFSSLQLSTALEWDPLPHTPYACILEGFATRHLAAGLAEVLVCGPLCYSHLMCLCPCTSPLTKSSTALLPPPPPLQGGYTPLHGAAVNGYAPVVAALLADAARGGQCKGRGEQAGARTVCVCVGGRRHLHAPL